MGKLTSTIITFKDRIMRRPPIKRRNKREALLRLLIYHGYILTLILHQLVHARTIDHFESNIKIRSLDYEDGRTLPEYDTGTNYSDSTNKYPSYPMVTINFIPPLVQVSVNENATALHQNVPIQARIRPNVTLNIPPSNIESSNQTRSQLLKSISSRNDYNINDLVSIQYSLTNHRNLFAIEEQTGEILLKRKPGNYTYILDVGVIIVALPDSPLAFLGQQPFRFETKAPVSVDVIDNNDNEPESVKNLLSCMAYDNIDTKTPICTALFKDADRGINSELTYSFSNEEGNDEEINNIRIDPRTGSIYRRYANVSFNHPEIDSIVIATDKGTPFLETSMRMKITILNSNTTIKRRLNEKPYIPDQHLKTRLTLTGTEEPGTSVSNLTPFDADGDVPVMHIVDGDSNSTFAIDDGSLIIAKKIDFSEKKTINLRLVITDGAEKSYLNVTVNIPAITRSIPNRFYNTSILLGSEAKVAPANSNLIDLSGFATNKSYAKFKLYSTSSKEASEIFKVDVLTGVVSLAEDIDYKFNGRHNIMMSIEDGRLPSDNYRSFVDLMIHVNLVSPPPPPPPPPPSTTTTTTSTTTTTTTTSTTTTTPIPTTTSTTTTTTTPTPTTSTTFLPPTSTITYSRPTQSSNSPYPTITYKPSVQPSISTFAPPIDGYPIRSDHKPPHVYPEGAWTPRPQSIWPQVVPDQPKYQPPAVPPYPAPPQWEPPTAQPPPVSPAPPFQFNDVTISVKTLAWAMISLMTLLFCLACTILLCKCCFRTPNRKRYLRGNGTMLDRSFHSQTRLHSHSPHANGSVSRNMNSRLSLRTAGHATPSSARGAQSKYGAGDSVSLSAMNERSGKHKALLPPPSPADNQSSILSHDVDDGLYANAFGPGHPQYLNELRRLKPDFTRQSARLPNSKKPNSSSNINSLRPPDNKNQSKSSSALPNTPVRSSSQAAQQIRGKVMAGNRPQPSRKSNNRSSDLNGSRTTNTSANVSPSLNDNNSRTVLLGSDDIRTPNHNLLSSNRQRQRSSKQVHTDSTADYDDVASHSTVDDTTPQTSSESASMSEIPPDSRFKTFVRSKKSKDSVNPSNTNKSNYNANSRIHSVDRYDRQLPPEPTGSEDTDNEPTTNLLSDYYADALPVRSNGTNQRDSRYSGRGAASDRLGGSGPVYNQNGSSEINNNHQKHESSDEAAGVNDNDSEEVDRDQSRDPLRKKHPKQTDDSDDSVDDEDEEDAEEGVYDLGTSN